MHRFIGSAAIAATLAFASVSSAFSPDSAAATQRPAAAALVPPGFGPASPAAPARPAPRPVDPLLAPVNARDSGLAPGQSAAAFNAWLASSPANRRALAAFRDHLAREGVADVVPLWQLVRTSSSWEGCGADPFEVAPADKWDHIVRTLKFVRDEVVPAIGRVEPLSAYRNAELNACSAGAPKSAHRHFHALDLTPVDPGVSRAEMVRAICAAHARHGRAYQAGLGFYSGKRFHVDSSGYRKWGPNGRGATSPCATGNYA